MAEMQSEEDKKRLAAEALLRAAQNLPPIRPMSETIGDAPQRPMDVSSVAPMERPLGSGPNDRRSTQVNELGTTTYDTAFGDTYAVDVNPDQRTLRNKVTDAVAAVPPVDQWRAPTGDELVAFSKALTESAWSIVDTPARALQGEKLTYGDVADVASMMPLGGLVAAGGDMSFDPDTLRMFIGPKAKNFDLGVGLRASDMEYEGASPEEIFKETLMVRVDGQWKQEVSDEDFRLGDLERQHIEDKNSFQRELGATRVRDLSQSTNSYDANYDKPVDVSFQEYRGGLRGSYLDSARRPIIKSYRQFDVKEQEETLLHEMQHAIQSQEGWEQGTNSKATAGVINNFFRDLPSPIQSYLHELTKVNKYFTQIDTYKKALKRGDETGDYREPQSYGGMAMSSKRHLEGYIRHLESTEDKVLKLAREYKNNFPEETKAVDEVSNLMLSTPHSLYESKLGEIEARLTASRADLSLEERANRFPDFTGGNPNTVWTEENLKSRLEDVTRRVSKASGTQDAYAHMLNDVPRSSSSSPNIPRVSSNDIDYNETVRKRRGLLDRDMVAAGDNVLYRPDRSYRFIGKAGYDDFTKSGEIRARQDSKKGYEVPYFMQGKSSSRYGVGEGGDYLVETIPSSEWKSASKDYHGPTKSLTKEDPIRVFKRNEAGSYEVIFDNIGDEALLPGK